MSMEYEDEDSLFTDAQELALGVTGVVTAAFSAVGSAFIIYVILSDRGANLSKAYCRLMLGLSFMDFLTSAGSVFFGPWMVPKDTPNASYGKGNVATCNVSGFFTNLILGSMYYTAALTIYFVLMIRFEVKEAFFARYIEPLFHAIAILIPFSSGIYGIVKGCINATEMLPGYCWFSRYPMGCEESYSFQQSPNLQQQFGGEASWSSSSSSSSESGDEPRYGAANLACIRGEACRFSAKFLMVGSILTVWFVILVAMILIYFKVRATEKRMSRYAGGATAKMQYTKQTGNTAMLYIGAYFLCYFPVTALLFLETEETIEARSLYFAFNFLTKLLMPLQGFFNVYIFLRSNHNTLARRQLSSVMSLVGRVSSGLAASSNKLEVPSTADPPTDADSPSRPGKNSTSSNKDEGNSPKEHTNDSMAAQEKHGVAEESSEEVRQDASSGKD